MSTPTKILIIYGSLNSVPSPEGAAPAKIIYETVTTFNKDCFTVLSNYNSNLKNSVFDKKKFIHVKSNKIDLLLYFLLELIYPYKKRREKFITGKKEQLLYYISVCRFLMFNKYDKIIVHVGIGLVQMIKTIFPKRDVILYHHGTSLHSKLNETQWKALISNCKAVFGVNIIALKKANNQFANKLNPSKYYNFDNAIIQKKAFQSLDNQDGINVNPAEFNFSFSGRVCIEKGVLNLLKAFLIVSKLNKNTRLYIFGGAGTKGKHNIITPYLQQCFDFVEKNKLPVVFTGYLKGNDLTSLLGKMDAIICPTDREVSEEGMPLSIIEALSLGKPVIATNSGGNEEVVLNENNGILITSYPYISELSKEMINLSSDKLRYEKLSKGTLQSFQERHTYKVYNKDLKKALIELNYLRD